MDLGRVHSSCMTWLKEECSRTPSLACTVPSSLLCQGPGLLPSPRGVHERGPTVSCFSEGVSRKLEFACLSQQLLLAALCVSVYRISVWLLDCGLKEFSMLVAVSTQNPRLPFPEDSAWFSSYRGWGASSQPRLFLASTSQVLSTTKSCCHPRLWLLPLPLGQPGPHYFSPDFKSILCSSIVSLKSFSTRLLTCCSQHISPMLQDF